ncbi:hypothetical protein GCK72_003567 [Caenorhabditis remanei]|uniref:Uncharacterized protein n=1 Tax=Caenorhabditis remanei TaxID=31234 RepID=A0A6A5HV83_CAERE|nr:hypothetical protein GCK72_003567 [Caenorhabditis remanei]KAF1771739.1 hypothetical protein GCK72_003567 [Caenorhabditis remanei]
MIFVASRRSLSTSPMPPPRYHQPPPPPQLAPYHPTHRRVPAWCNMTSDERQEHKKQLEELRLREHMKEQESQRNRRDPGGEQQLLTSCAPLLSHAPRVIVFDYENEKKVKSSRLRRSRLDNSNNSLFPPNQMPTKLDIVGNLKFSSSTDDGDKGDEDENGDVTACFVLPSPSSFSKLTILDNDEEYCEFGKK